MIDRGNESLEVESPLGQVERSKIFQQPGFPLQRQRERFALLLPEGCLPSKGLEQLQKGAVRPPTNRKV